MQEDNTGVINKFREGDNNAFSIVYRLHYVSLWHFAHYLIDNKADAEDIVANAFFKLWKQCATFNSLDRIKPFLVVVTRNACCDYLKHNKVKKAAREEFIYLQERSEDSIQATIMKGEILQKAIDQIELLPEKMRQIFKLSFLNEGMSNAEISLALNISENTVRVQKANAYRYLKINLRKTGMV
jgi:RNA polymerase sigma-70 factor (ECF subfamily)